MVILGFAGWARSYGRVRLCGLFAGWARSYGWVIRWACWGAVVIVSSAPELNSR